MKRFFKVLDKVHEGLLFIVLLTMVSIVASNVFSRFILGTSISWGEEVAKILLTYLTFLGASYAIKDNSHYTFDFLLHKISKPIIPYFLAFRWLVIITISSLLLYWSVEVTVRISDWIMPSTGLNRAVVYGVTPLSMFFLIIYAIRNFIEDWNGTKDYTETTEIN